MHRLSAGMALMMTVVLPAVSIADQRPHSPYAGQEGREIKSLSPEDIKELRRGGGWGLAKAAELNGYPGPAHLLEMKAEIGLSEQQTAAIKVIYEGMKQQAVRLGEELIRHEQRLEESFRDRTVDEAALREALDGIAAIRRDLRFAHLAAHLKVMPHLTAPQVAAYWKLRGYGTPAPCAEAPPGHNPALWREHHCPVAVK